MMSPWAGGPAIDTAGEATRRFAGLYDDGGGAITPSRTWSCRPEHGHPLDLDVVVGARALAAV